MVYIYIHTHTHTHADLMVVLPGKPGLAGSSLFSLSTHPELDKLALVNSTRYSLLVVSYVSLARWYKTLQPWHTLYTQTQTPI